MSGMIRSVCRLAGLVAFAATASLAQNRPAGAGAALRLRIDFPASDHHRAVPAAIWLDPLSEVPSRAPDKHRVYTLLQKNRTFIPHLQIIPVDSVVQFPNADPFFHNVFSLFDGKRFNLGLYEAGSSKSVTFSRAGVSYIFCNIHPEMSAVIITLTTPYYVIADRNGAFVLRSAPPGDYRLHFWIEGIAESQLERLDRTVHLSPHGLDLGTIRASSAVPSAKTHDNMYGKAYAPDTQPTY